YDALAKDWLTAVCAVVAPYARPGGPLLAIQLNDETIFCCSNDPPWRLGYEPSSMRAFHELLQDRYGQIENYNQLHGTDYPAFDFIRGPQPLGFDEEVTEGPRQRGGIFAYVDWAEHQWRLRRDTYVRYKNYAGIHVPYLTNFAGITPPIEENIPDQIVDGADQAPPQLAKTYSDWWFAMNRIDQDADAGAYEYGMISWLGVAAYDETVFDRYVNTARRRRGINMEENWGFAALYDPRSRYPIVPVFQTLVSLAAGATGYTIYTGTSTDYWDDHLDRVTKKQCPTFPSDAPIDVHGNPGLLYNAAAMLNRWFAEHGEALLACEPLPEAAYMLYAPYAAVASWIPDKRYWAITEHDLPRCGYEAFEPWSSGLQRAGFSPVMQELETVSLDWMLVCQSVSMHVAFFMGRNEQQKLADFIRGGGRLFISGELPTVDLDLQPCTVLKDTLENHGHDQKNVTYRRENLFADGSFASRLIDAGLRPRVTCSDRLRVMVHYGEQDQFIFFFYLGEDSASRAWMELDGQRIEMQLGSKTCGVLRKTGGRIRGYFIKGHNEIDATIADVRIEFGEQVIEGRGDLVE
ncbi:MAG: hypothetical protein JW829_13330, partial [Pirellulales bacterium]|nr:hypothetical protein [Pirellulales bacterium]